MNEACQKLDSSLLSPSTSANHRVLSISLQIHSKYVSLLPCPLTRSRPSQNYHGGFLSNCPPSVPVLFIHLVVTLAYTLQQLLISHMTSPKSSADTGLWSADFYPFLFSFIPKSPFLSLHSSHPDLLSGPQTCQPPSRFRSNRQTHIWLGLYLSDSNWNVTSLGKLSLMHSPAWVRSLCYVLTLYSSYQHCNQLFP